MSNTEQSIQEIAFRQQETAGTLVKGLLELKEIKEALLTISDSLKLLPSAIAKLENK